MKGVSIISNLFKKLHGNKYVNRSGKNKAISRENTSTRKLFKKSVSRSAVSNNCNLKPADNIFKRLNRTIGNFRNIIAEKVKNFIESRKASKPDKPIKVATRAKDVIPEFLGKAANLDQAEEFVNPNVGKNKQENIAEGGFGVVQHAYAKRKNARQNMSRLFVKKKLIKHQPDKVFSEHQTNKFAGIASKVDVSGSSIVTEYGGEMLSNLFIAEQQDTQTKTSTTMIEDGTTKEMLYNSKKMSFETKVDLAKQLLTEISKLHKKGLIHTDIKADNILVNNKGKLSIIDFGGSQDVSANPNPDKAVVSLRAYTEDLAPPEITRSILVNNRYDSWSAGEVIYELFTGKNLLEGVDNPKTWDQQKKETLTQNMRDNVINNPNVPQEAKTLIYALLAPDPENRISVTDALKLNLFTSQELYGKPSLIALSTEHDEKFKELARLENELTKIGITELKRQELKAKIKYIGSAIKKLQEEINKF
jgi:serine/threonine protein kinase/ribosomal protein S19